MGEATGADGRQPGQAQRATNRPPPFSSPLSRQVFRYLVPAVKAHAGERLCPALRINVRRVPGRRLARRERVSGVKAATSEPVSDSDPLRCINDANKSQQCG